MGVGQREVASKILDLLLPYQRASATEEEGHPTHCAQCREVHLPRVEKFVEEGRPVDLVLPAFPGKSPNRSKVLGAAPDMAEWLSVSFLNELCEQVKTVYAPGARLIICSDGRVFSDLVRIPDEDITLYQVELAVMLRRAGAHSVSLYNLDNRFGACEFDEMRRQLMEEHGEPLEQLKEAVRAGGEPLSLYRGITRFLLEDASGPHVQESKTALQKECRQRAYGVIQRSKAWGNLVAEVFPSAVRLSIHPQPCGSEKLGIHMLETADNWLTPWHGTAVKIGGRFVLMKRADAEQLGAELIHAEGRPSHFVAREGTALPAHLAYGPQVAAPDERARQARRA